MNEKNVSFVIPVTSFNSCLKKTLEGILTQNNFFEREFEILVIQNGPREIVPEWLEKIPSLKVFWHERRSIPLARNAGIKHAKFPLLGFIDDDSLCPPEWLDEMLSFFDSPPCRWSSKSHAFKAEEKFFF